jgi:hypothetical protein
MVEQIYDDKLTSINRLHLLLYNPLDDDCSMGFSLSFLVFFFPRPDCFWVSRSELCDASLCGGTPYQLANISLQGKAFGFPTNLLI